MLTRNKKITRFEDSAAYQFNVDLGSSACEAPEFSEVFKEHKQKQFSAKEVIYRESDPVDKIFVILSGMVKLLSYLPNGRARIVRLHAHSHWLGLEGLVGQLHEHTAVAVDDIEVAYVPMNSLHLLERTNPRQYGQILKQGYKYLAQADRCILDFSTGGIKPRVARLVKFLSTLEYGESSDMVELLTVHEMADMLGVTPESVSRVLAEFKRNDTLHRLNGLSDEIYEIDFQQLQYVTRQ